MRKILSIFSLFLLSVSSLAQEEDFSYLERLDSIVSDNGDITRFKYDEQLRVVEKSVFQNDRLVRKEVTEYAEDGKFSDFCVYEGRKRNDDMVLVPVHRKVRTVKDNGSCIELSDSVEVEGQDKLAVSTFEVLTYDENDKLISRCTKTYDPQSAGTSYNQHEIYYDAEGNRTNETIIGSDYKYTQEYMDGRLYVLSKYVNRNDQWAIMESTVREYYESGALKCEYSYDYSGIIFYMKDYVLYDENGEKVKSQEDQKTYSYKYIRDEKGRVKEVQKYLFDSDVLVGREEFYYDVLAIDSAYYTLHYANDATEPYAKYYYIPNRMVGGKIEGDYSLYEKDTETGLWVNRNLDGNELSYSFADKAIIAHYEVNDESINFTDYTLTVFSDFGKTVRREEKGLMTNEEDVYYDKSLSGSLIAGLEEDYKVAHITSRDASGNEVKSVYFYTSLAVTTSISRISPSLANQPIYNIQGLRLTSPQKGMNIINGKKIITVR